MKKFLGNVRKLSTSSTHSNFNLRRLSLNSSSSTLQIKVLRGGYNIDLEKVDGSFHKLHKAAYLNQEDKVKKYLHSSKYSVNSQDSALRTALHLAAVNGNISIIQMLIGAGANVNIVDSDGKTPLIKAAECGHHDVIKLLIESGANVDIADKEKGNTVLHHCLITANLVSSLYIIRNALIIDYNKRNYRKETFLHLAAKIVDLFPVIEELIANGIEIEATDELGRTAVDIAQSHSNPDAYRIISKYAAASRHQSIISHDDQATYYNDPGEQRHPPLQQSISRASSSSQKLSGDSFGSNGSKSYYRFSGLFEETILEEQKQSSSSSFSSPIQTLQNELVAVRSNSIVSHQLSENIYVNCNAGNLVPSASPDVAKSTSLVTLPSDQVSYQTQISNGHSRIEEFNDGMSDLDQMLQKDLNIDFELQTKSSPLAVNSFIVQQTYNSAKSGDWLELLDQTTDSDNNHNGSSPKSSHQSDTINQLSTSMNVNGQHNTVQTDSENSNHKSPRTNTTPDIQTLSPRATPEPQSSNLQRNASMSYAQVVASPRKSTNQQTLQSPMVTQDVKSVVWNEKHKFDQSNTSPFPGSSVKPVYSSTPQHQSAVSNKDPYQLKNGKHHHRQRHHKDSASHWKSSSAPNNGKQQDQRQHSSVIRQNNHQSSISSTSSSTSSPLHQLSQSSVNFSFRSNHQQPQVSPQQLQNFNQRQFIAENRQSAFPQSPSMLYTKHVPYLEGQHKLINNNYNDSPNDNNIHQVAQYKEQFVQTEPIDMYKEKDGDIQYKYNNLLAALDRLLFGEEPPSQTEVATVELNEEVRILKRLTNLIYDCNHNKIELDFKRKEVTLLKQTVDTLNLQIEREQKFRQELEAKSVEMASTAAANAVYQKNGQDFSQLEQQFQNHLYQFESVLNQQFSENELLKEECRFLREQLVSSQQAQLTGINNQSESQLKMQESTITTGGTSLLPINEKKLGSLLAKFEDKLVLLDELNQQRVRFSQEESLQRSTFFDQFCEEISGLKQIVLLLVNGLMSGANHEHESDTQANGTKLSGHIRRHSDGTKPRRLTPRKSFSLHDLAVLGEPGEVETDVNANNIPAPEVSNMAGRHGSGSNFQTDYSNSFSYKSKYFQKKINDLRKQLGLGLNC